jgi:acetate kinase
MDGMDKATLVINAGSSSFKFSVFQAFQGGLASTVQGQIQGIGTTPSFEARDSDGAVVGREDWADSNTGRVALFDFLVRWLENRLGGVRLVAAGHRIVHGGARFRGPALIDPAVVVELEGLIPLAPLHQPHAVAAIKALSLADPALPQVACFDTAFHQSQPWRSQAFGIPHALSEEGIRRYGFHGLSYAYIASRLPEIDPGLAQAKVIAAHLGNGASLCAMEGGRSIDGSTGFSTIEGLMMGTRSGSIDPGVLIHLMRNKGMSLDAVETMLFRESGLLGVSGISNDMRLLLGSADPRAARAVELYCHTIVKWTGALASSMGGIDAFVFTAGIGEHAAPVRARVCAMLGWLGVRLDEAANDRGERWISAPDSRIPVLVLPTDEERMIAIDTLKTVEGRR